jgi:PhnB protein
MSVTTATHPNFRGDARVALDFYHCVVGGRLAAVPYKDAGAVRAGGEADWVMWGEVVAGDGFPVMAYDVPSALPWARGENAFFVALRGDSAEGITALWGKPAAGATVVRPLGPAPWAPLYGVLTDRFGVVRVLDAAVPGAAGGAR